MDESGTKKLTVFRWRQRHPEGRKADCVRDTGLTKPTVYKWWDEASPINFREAGRERFVSLQQQLRQEISQMTPRKMPASDKEQQAMKRSRYRKTSTSDLLLLSKKLSAMLGGSIRLCFGILQQLLKIKRELQGKNR